MPRASATSAAKSAFSTLTAPVNGVPTRWPRQVNQVRPGANTTSLASPRCTGTIGMRPWRSNRWPQGSSALITPRTAWSAVNSALFTAKYSSIVPW